MKEATKQEAKMFAVSRMDFLNLRYDLVTEFEKHGKIAKAGPGVAPRWLSKNELTVVRKIERKFKVMVYHVLVKKDSDEVCFLCVSYSKRGWHFEMTGYNKMASAYIMKIGEPIEQATLWYIFVERLLCGGLMRKETKWHHGM